MAFWEDYSSSRTPFKYHQAGNEVVSVSDRKMYDNTVSHHVPKAANKAAPPDQPARASCRVGARPTCRQ
eukprot:5298965-Prymnesium_polylepis.1